MQKIENHEDAVRWIYGHEGKNQAWWEAQRQLNARTDDRLAGHGARIGKVERKLVAITAAAAAGGSLLGAILSDAIKLVGG